MWITRNHRSRLFAAFMLMCSLVLANIIPVPIIAAQSDLVVPEAATAQAGSSSWISVQSPFTGDANRNSYTLYEYSTSTTGPWTPACSPGIPGESAWRVCAFGGLSAGTDYFVRVTFVDPDGVNGSGQQVIGPVRTPTTAQPTVTVGAATVIAQDTSMLVSTPISGDANRDSSLQAVDIATSPGGPWVTKCGPHQGSFSPQLCRIHGLIHNTSYWVRVTISDPDGVNGPNPQTLGPIQYTGLTNLALGSAITADPGWGCCLNATELVDGRIQNPDWTYGFAWTGGTGGWAGGAPGWKQATIDLGMSQSIARLDWWTHDPGNIPLAWKVEVSSDNSMYTQIFSTVAPQCRTTTESLNTAWYFPSCGQTARFGPVTARYVRYWFDDRTLINGIHGWAVELEVFGPDTSPIPTQVDPAKGCGGEINIYGTGFTSGLSATLHNNIIQMTLQNPDVMDSTHIHASIPIDIPAGVYNLTITNPDSQSGMLANAYMAVEAVGGLSATNNGPAKPGASTTMMATISTGADVTYMWNFGDGSTGAGATTTHTYGTSGDYIATVTATNCRGSASASTTVHVSSDAPPPGEDLLPASNGLWLDPPIGFQCNHNNAVGLTVQRQDGASPLSNVAVNFYVGDPKAGGTLIGSGTVKTLSANSQADTTKVTWRAVAGIYTLYAVIDPTNQVSERDETNNTISRTVTVQCYVFLPMANR